MSTASNEELPDGPVTGPDGVAVHVNVGRTAAVGPLPELGDEVGEGGSTIGAYVLVKALRLIQVHVFRVKPWTVTVASAVPSRKVVHRRYRTEDEATQAALDVVRRVEAQGVAGF